MVALYNNGMDTAQRQRAKHDVGQAAAQMVQPGMLVGLGTGSTAAPFIEALAQRVREGLKIEAVATSRNSDELARTLGIPMRNVEEITQIDLTIDGADCIDPKKQMIKGGGGALLREKLLALSSKELVVVIDADKWKERLGGVPLPIEIVYFAYRTTLQRLEKIGLQPKLRMAGDRPYVTDNGNFIADCPTTTLDDPPTLHSQIKSVVGVVETGLFFNVAGRVLVGLGDGRVEIR
jgi:ribose 5-phosphate isomerase A